MVKPKTILWGVLVAGALAFILPLFGISMMWIVIPLIALLGYLLEGGKAFAGSRDISHPPSLHDDSFYINDDDSKGGEADFDSGGN